MRTEEIVGKVFTRTFMGYDIEQVDVFLDEVIECIEQYEAEKREMLTAMEYLLKKLENGRKLPIAEMRKAIDSGKPPKKRAATADRKGAVKTVKTKQKRADGNSVRAEKPAGEQTETKAAARSILRGSANGVPKPVRAPKVKRVAKAEPAQPEGGAGESIADKTTRDDWLEELLGNLSERDQQGYPAKAAEPAAADGVDPKDATPKHASANNAEARGPKAPDAFVRTPVVKKADSAEPKVSNGRLSKDDGPKHAFEGGVSDRISKAPDPLVRPSAVRKADSVEPATARPAAKTTFGSNQPEAVRAPQKPDYSFDRATTMPETPAGPANAERPDQAGGTVPVAGEQPNQRPDENASERT